MFLLQPQTWTTTLTPVSRVAGRGMEEGLMQLFVKLSLDISSLCLATPPRLPGKHSGCYFIWNYWNPTVSCQLFPLPGLSWETDTMDGLSCQDCGTAQHTHAHTRMLAPLPVSTSLLALFFFSPPCVYLTKDFLFLIPFYLSCYLSPPLYLDTSVSHPLFLSLSLSVSLSCLSISSSGITGGCMTFLYISIPQYPVFYSGNKIGTPA